MYTKLNSNNKVMITDLAINDNHFEIASTIETAITKAEYEQEVLAEKIEESLETIKKLTPQCDKLDYILSASIGSMCGFIDIFLVGKPGESPLGDKTDKFFGNCVKSFAKRCGWKNKCKDKKNEIKSAIGFLERKFKIPYDLRGAGDAAKEIFELNPRNHHFKSLAHNPTILGLVFSIIDQFCNTATFVTGGELISLQDANENFELKGNDIPSKIFCGFVNWFGHLISDVSGSKSSKERGMGIPSSFWSWTNDIIAIKRKLNIPVWEFEKSLNKLALDIYNKGYDARFQTTQAIPVIINELIVRLTYSVRRVITYFASTVKDERSFTTMWKACEPFSNATVKRMLTVAHGTFCLFDIGEATIRGFVKGAGTFNVIEFALRLNIVGVGRFTISIYGEGRRAVKKIQAKEEYDYLIQERDILEDYMEGLKLLSVIYDDRELVNFTDDLKNSDLYKLGFMKSIELAKKRNVASKDILESKADIDNYFIGEN